MMIKVDNENRWVEVAGSLFVDQVNGSWVLKVSGTTVRTYASEQDAFDDASRVADLVGVLEL